MIQIPKIPGLPEREEVEFKEKELLLSVAEQFRSSAKVWFYLLAGVLILAWPLKNLLVEKISDFLIGRQVELAVNLVPYTPQALRLGKAQILQVSPGVFSIVVQVSNPNPDISVHRFSYQFVIRDKAGEIIRRYPDESYLLPGENRFLAIPRLALSGEPSSAELLVNKVRWTIRIPAVEPKLEVQQKNFGTTPEGNIFVEGLVKNLQGFVINKVEVLILAFDRTNRKVLAVNETVLTELKAFENRYFRVTWPKGTNQPLAVGEIGEIRVLPSLNPFESEFTLEKEQIKPDR